MHRFQTILVYPVAFDMADPAVATATRIASETGANLVVVALDPSALPGSDSEFARYRQRLEHRRALVALAAELGERGIAIATSVLAGSSPAESLCDAARRKRADLLIKTARADDVPRSRVFSSIATKLLQHCPCPVWVVRPSQPTRDRRILAAIDPIRDADPQRVDRDVLDVAQQLVGAHAAELHVVAAWQPAGASLLAHRLPAEEYKDHVRECERDAARALRRFLAAGPETIPSHRIHLHRGDAPSIIAKVAEKIAAEMIVVGSAGRTGMQRWVMGNTAEEVLKLTDRTLVGVRATPELT